MDPLQKIERTSTAPDHIQDEKDKEEGTFGSVSWLCVKGAEHSSCDSNSKEVPAPTRDAEVDM